MSLPLVKLFASAFPGDGGEKNIHTNQWRRVSSMSQELFKLERHANQAHLRAVSGSATRPARMDFNVNMDKTGGDRRRWNFRWASDENVLTIDNYFTRYSPVRFSFNPLVKLSFADAVALEKTDWIEIETVVRQNGNVTILASSETEALDMPYFRTTAYVYEFSGTLAL